MRILVLGSGVSGKAAARLAVKLGHAVTVFDERPGAGVDLLSLGVGVVAGSWDRELLAGVDLVVASPGFSDRSIPVVDCLEAGLPIWSEVEFAWRQLDDVRVVAITGTNGKTTTTLMTTEMLTASGVAAESAGNIGTALSDLVDTEAEVLVVEVSSFQLRFIDRFRADAAAILNIAEDHLDWHGSVEAYAAAKARICERQGADDLVVFNADDPVAAKAVGSAAARRFPISLQQVPVDGGGVADGVLRVGELEVAVSEIGSDDPAYVFDLACAGALALDQGATPEAVAEVMKKFTPSVHRRTHVATVDGVAYVNDSKATNLHAALAAVAAYPSVVLIAGGLAKGSDLTPLARSPRVRHLVAIGEAAPSLLAEAGDRGHPAGSMEEAVAMARNLAEPGDTVLLAPGGASFDQFDSYGHRGDVFSAAVLSLGEETQ